MDISDGFVWVVQQRVDGVPAVLSVHTDKSSAWEAAVDYMDSTGRRDYSVNPMKLNSSNSFVISAGKSLTTQGE